MKRYLTLLEELSRSGAEAVFKRYNIDPSKMDSEQIKKAYRSLALKYHSDLGGDDQAMKQINAAYDVLKKPVSNNIPQTSYRRFSVRVMNFDGRYFNSEVELSFDTNNIENIAKYRLQYILYHMQTKTTPVAIFIGLPNTKIIYLIWLHHKQMGPIQFDLNTVNPNNDTDFILELPGLLNKIYNDID